MFGNAKCSAHFHAVAIFAHQDDRVCVGQDVARFDAALDQLIDHHFVAGVKQQAADVFVVVRVLFDRFCVLSKLSTEEVASHPVGFLPQDLMIDVFEHVELKRVAGSVSRFDAVHDAASNSVDEVSVKEADRFDDLFLQVDFPALPIVQFHITDRDSATGSMKNVHRIEASGLPVPDLVSVDFLASGFFSQFPTEQAIGVVGVILHVASRSHVKDDSVFAILLQTFSRELNAKLRLADSCCAHNDRQFAGKKSATKHFIQSRNSCQQSIRHELLSLRVQAVKGVCRFFRRVGVVTSRFLVDHLLTDE